MTRLEQLTHYLKDQPKDPFLNHAIGLEHLKAGNIEAAIKSFKLVLENQPDYIGTYYQLARAYELVGDIAQAHATYHTGIQQAEKAGDNHALSELSTALENSR